MRMNMKKLAVFFLIIVIIIVGISYMYLSYKANYHEAQRENNQFEIIDSYRFESKRKGE